MPITRLLESHYREVMTLEEGAVRRLFRIYREASLEIAGRLAEMDDQGRGENSVAQHLALIGAQIDGALDVMWRAHGRELGAAFGEALHLGARQSRSEILDLERRFGDVDLAQRINLIPPTIPAQRVAFLTKPQNLLVSRFRDGVATAIHRELATSVALGEGIPQAARRLRKTMAGERHQLERLARTEINHAANSGHLYQLQTVAAELPQAGLMKQWSGHLDTRICARCRGLHLQVREVHEAFVARDGWRGAAGPCHPNDRCRVMPYSPRWERDSVKKIAEQAPGTALNPLHLSNPTAGDRRSAERSNRARGTHPDFSGPDNDPSGGMAPGSFEFSSADRVAADALLDGFGLGHSLRRAGVSIDFAPEVVYAGQNYRGMTLRNEITVATHYTADQFGQPWVPGETDTTAVAGSTRHDAIHRTLVHETGHALLNTHPGAKERVEAVFKEARDQGRFITAAASEAPSEYFCESMVAYHFHRGDLERYDRRGHDLVEEILGVVRKADDE